jgi:DNA-binding GntR family transcriptional regulator
MNTAVKSARSRNTLRAYEGLRRLLLQDQLPAGTRLAEVEWSSRLKTSRPAVREAFAMLAHEELLARGERGGFFVTKYTEVDLHKILQARIVIETGALRLLAGIEPDLQLLDRMGEYCKTMEYLLDHEVLLGFGEIDRKFHATLVELTGNEWLVRMYRRTPSSHFAFPEVDSAAIRVGGLAAIRDHREIHEAICQRRTEDAVAALQKHLTVDPSLHFKF